MRRREFEVSPLLAAAVGSGPAQPHRKAIVHPSDSVAHISATGIPPYQTFFAELLRLDLEPACEALGREPDLILAITPPLSSSAMQSEQE